MLTTKAPARPLRLILASALAATLITGCAPSLLSTAAVGTQATGSMPSQAPRAAIAHLQLNASADSTQAQGLRASFAKAILLSGQYSAVDESLPLGPAPQGLQTFDLVLTPSYQQHFSWPWYVGVLALGPLWPIMPRDGLMELDLDVSVVQDGKTLQKAHLVEKDTFDLFWYGAYRQGALQEQADFLVRKLMDRLTSTLQAQQPSDLALIDESKKRKTPVL